jgi:hypothetical protein
MHIGMSPQLSPKPNSWANWSQVIGGVQVPSVTAAAEGVVVVGAGGGQSESGNWQRPPSPGMGTQVGGGAGTHGGGGSTSVGRVVVGPAGVHAGGAHGGRPMPGRASQFGTGGGVTTGATGAFWT